ncbi:RNA polymerase III RPC4-domain-containing protein [Aspergillus ambiguus]|uniref:putative DNA-directed RNA polymerase III RPC4 n=1 Tax=Aspergillus ambiguus TaxID=176160 RepID=UPI003CCE3A3C
MPPKAPPRRGASTGTGTTRPTQTQTPTPATSSSRPPVQRLQSLKKRAPSTSISPSSSSTTRPNPTPGPGDPPKPTLKYKPRAVGRRSKEEREAIEKLEAERHRERLAEAAAIQRGRGGRGGAARGGGRGRGDGARRGRGGGFTARFADSRASSMSRRSRSVIDLGSGRAGDRQEEWSSDESDGEVRISIDRINLESDDEAADAAEGKKGKMAVKELRAGAGGGGGGLRPVRVERHEHEERVVSVNMESSSSRSAELREQAKAKAKEADGALFVAAEDADAPRVKEEPRDEDEDRVMTDVAPAHEEAEAGRDDGFLPKQKVKVRRNLSREPTEAEAEPDEEEEEPAAVKDPKSLLRTKEDVDEYERHEKDLELMRELLSKEEEVAKEAPAPAATGEQTETAAADADTTADDGKEKDGEDAPDDSAKDKLAGHLFLVQFPPITPGLVVPGEDANANANAPSEGAADASDANADAVIKREEDVEVLDDAEDQTGVPRISPVVTATDWRLRAGRVGKLNVHASGRVTMDWGGISFELDRATEVDFLQEALIVSTPPDAEADTPDEENKVWAMGQLSGKFTVTPNWGEML